MRILIASCSLALLPLAPALADTLVATNPGLMCTSAAALAKLTRPDGTSRTAYPEARPEDWSIKQAGGCIDIVPGSEVTVLRAMKNTSVVSYDAHDGRRALSFTVPNIDFTKEAREGSRFIGGDRPNWQDRVLFQVEAALKHDHLAPKDCVAYELLPPNPDQYQLPTSDTVRVSRGFGGSCGEDPGIDEPLFFVTVDRKTGRMTTTARDPDREKESVLKP